mgnify:CR=1 FL=1
MVGGFGLLPLLSATGVWRLAAGLLCGLGVAAGALSVYTDWRARTTRAESGGLGALGLGFALATAIATLTLLSSEGPTAVWRHSGIGVGRAQIQSLGDNSLRNYVHARHRTIVWEKDGVESSVALSIDNSGMAFVVNGKADGNARGDAATQVVSGLVGALLHPQPRQALVIGLGTGSTAGWLGAIADIQRVDVAEIDIAACIWCSVADDRAAGESASPTSAIEMGGRAAPQRGAGSPGDGALGNQRAAANGQTAPPATTPRDRKSVV